MRLTIFSILIPLILLFLVIGALPTIITLIYKFFYNNHVNRVLEADAAETIAADGDSKDADSAGTAGNSGEFRGASTAAKNPAGSGFGKPARRWMSPRSVFLIALFGEILIYVALGMISKATSPDSGDEYPDADLSAAYETLYQEDVDETILTAFDGSEVSGYELSAEEDSDISYALYENTGISQLPEYVICLTYTGSEDITYWDNTLYGDDADAAAMGDFVSDEAADSNTTGSTAADTNEKTLYVVIGSSISNYSNVSYELNLYTGDREETSDGFGTYDTPEPAASITIELR